MFEEFKDYVNKAVNDGVFPGCNIAIVCKKKNGEYQENFFSFGNKALYPNVIKNNIDTIYDMASCSKVISTTTSIMLLMERGMIKLYDLVSTYLPDYKETDITIWDLLTHTSGLPEALAGCWTMNKEQIIDGIIHLEKKYPKNSGIHYSDAGFLTLGLIVKEVSGMPLDEFAYENIYKPLGMVDTGYNPTKVDRCAPTEDRGEHIDLGYVHDEMAKNVGGVAGHAGLFSTVKDLSKFCQMILNGGTYNGKKIMDKKTVDLLFVPQVREQIGISLDYNMRCLGWIPKNENCCGGDLISNRSIMHTGFTGTSVVIDKDNEFAFVMLSNRVHPTRKNTKIISFRPRITNYICSHLEEFRGE